MCGIAGIYHYAEPDRPVDEALLKRMTRALAHRGPDGEGFYVKGPIGLGHRRLAIVDPSSTGAQPMANHSQTCSLSYNGEFYNHKSYRERLQSRGYQFRGTSDTETLLYLLEEHGPDALEDVAGIFAFAFWDARRQHLTLARDPLGVKQLYWYDDGRRILFASEIKALLQCADVPREPDAEAINQYLHFHTPLFERTFFRHIRQLRAGEYLRVSRYTTEARTYWSLQNFNKSSALPEARVDELRASLDGVIRDQLMSDVPLGCFFSGGIDSTAVAAYAARNGIQPECFGVHFSDQGVIDERPYQEMAASQLGLSLNLITCDGSTFPDDLARLVYHQDQPVIGPALIPMYYVSRLAATKVKVCLGGQAADEIFGGYARYALTRQSHVLRSWFSGRGRGRVTSESSATGRVGGNLGRQLRDKKNIRRLIRNLSNIGDWEERYFHHFAKIPEQSLQSLFAAPGLVSRAQCREIYHDTLKRSAAIDPADKAMHWDLQTYLTGLFHQDDRMSMAVSLESRVPLADPRIVRFAFQTGFDLKFRAGATKWILRQAVSDVLPDFVLNRRKVGFDTPVESWMRNKHADFVRDLLLSRRCRSRGLLDPNGVRTLLEDGANPFWIDMAWKALCIESWATIFLDDNRDLRAAADCEAIVCSGQPEPKALGEGQGHKSELTVKDAIQEVRELGLAGTAARMSWEFKSRLGANGTKAVRESRHAAPEPARPGPYLFADPLQVARQMRTPQTLHGLETLLTRAREASKGRVFSFGRWTADYGHPIDWHRNPHNGQRWRADAHWSKSLTGQSTVGDPKLTWEPGRFPHAYLLARAAAFYPEAAEEFCCSLTAGVREFLRQNPVGMGIHWNSGQEVAIRCVAWIFALDTFSRLSVSSDELQALVLGHITEAGAHIAAHIQYARDCVNNNHLISEALGLYLAGSVSSAPEAAAWLGMGHDMLSAEADRQFFSDGAYLQQSHNYHRSVLQLYLCAASLARQNGQTPDERWKQAMLRSIRFLFAHQNPGNGALPNYGANDGAMPCVLTTCDFTDFRPTLQALSVAAAGERLYDWGPWDEEAAWFCGAEELRAAPLRRLERGSVAFPSGYQVMRGHNPSSFATLRCGSVPNRFSQIDMLHLDLWWKGHNVLVDGGSYLYNGPADWHGHFSQTGSHNTVTIDSRDQMLRYRKFKNLYWTDAALTRFEDSGEWVLFEGEHYGYQRHPGACIHKRSVLFVKEDLWIVADTISGSGRHDIQWNWLCAPYPYDFDAERSHLRLETPSGPFSLLLLQDNGAPLHCDVVAGSENPIRGWLSRHYGEKIPAPSLMAHQQAVPLPLTVVTILAAGDKPKVRVEGRCWEIQTGSREIQVDVDGTLSLVATAAAEGRR